MKIEKTKTLSFEGDVKEIQNALNEQILCPQPVRDLVGVLALVNGRQLNIGTDALSFGSFTLEVLLMVGEKDVDGAIENKLTKSQIKVKFKDTPRPELMKAYADSLVEGRFNGRFTGSTIDYYREYVVITVRN